MSPSSNAPRPHNLNILLAIATLVTGGLGGALFNSWLASRKTVVAYTIITETVGSATARSVIPDLKIQVGTEEVPVIHIHTVELSTQGGPYVDSAEVEIQFSSSARTFGKREEAPAGQHILCKNFIRGILPCQIGPLDAEKESRSSASGLLIRDSTNYRILMATDQADQPIIHIEGRNVQLVKAQNPSELSTTVWFGFICIALGVFLGGTLLLLMPRLRRLLRPLPAESSDAETKSSARKQASKKRRQP